MAGEHLQLTDILRSAVDGSGTVGKERFPRFPIYSLRIFPFYHLRFAQGVLCDGPDVTGWLLESP